MTERVRRTIIALLAISILLGGMSLAFAEDESPAVSIMAWLGNYTVRFDDYDGTLIKKWTDIPFGTPAAGLAPAAPARAGYTFEGWFPTVTDYTIMKNEVFIATYRANAIYTLTVTYSFDSDSRQAAPTRVETLEEGSVYSFDSPAVVGYHPDRAVVAGTVTADTVINVLYYPNTDTPYKVEHYLEALDGAYAMDSADALAATSDTMVTVAAKAYPGFYSTTGSVSVLVAADGSTMVKMYYNRSTYAITFNSYGGTYVPPIVGKYGKAVAAPADPTRMGYIFQSWDAPVPASMPAGNLTLTAIWTPGTAGYTIVYWQENANDSNYTFVMTDTGSGTTEDTIVLPAEKTSDTMTPFAPYFSFGAYDAGVVIKGDGTSVVNVYYTRNLYTIAFNLNDASFNGNAITTKAALEMFGTTYTTATSQYSFTVKYDSNISNLWPLLNNFNTLPGYSSGISSVQLNLYAWDPPHSDIYYVSKRQTLTAALIQDPTKNSKTTYNAIWVADTHITQLHYYIESLIQEPGGSRVLWGPDIYGVTRYYEDSVYSQTASCGNSQWNAKQISGVTNVGKDGNCIPMKVHVPPYEANFYYVRNIYNLAFYNYNEVDSTVSFKFGASIEAADYTPPKPAVLAEGFTFGGWYTTPDCIAGTEFVWAGAVMPSGNMMLYAKWLPPQRVVTFNIIQIDNAVETFKTESVPYGGTVSRPADPSKPGYDFDGWYYTGTATPFEFSVTQIYEDLILEARWKPSENVSYRVYYRSALTLDDVAAPKLVTGQRMASTVTETAARVAGYLPDVSSKSLTLAADGNEIIFLYTPLDNVKYTVRYLSFETNLPLHPEEVFDAESQASTDRVTVYARVIPGYYPEAYQRMVWLTADSSANIITFFYFANGTAPYTVRHYLQVLNPDGSTRYEERVADRTQTVGPIGLAVTATPNTYPQYDFVPTLGRISGNISKSPFLELELYYNLKVYKVVYNEGANGDLDGQDAAGNVVYPVCLYGSPTPDAPDVLPEDRYVFTGWLPVPTPTVTGDALYVAQYSPYAAYSIEYYYAEGPDAPYVLRPEYTYVSGLLPVGTMSPAGFRLRSENGYYALVRVENNPVLISAVDADNVMRVYYRHTGEVPLGGVSGTNVGDTYE